MDIIQSELKAMVGEMIYEVKYQISAWSGGPHTSYHQVDLYPQTKVRLGVSKKVLKVPLALGVQSCSTLNFLLYLYIASLFFRVEVKWMIACLGSSRPS